MPTMQPCFYEDRYPIVRLILDRADVFDLTRTQVLPLLFLDIDGVMLKRREAGLLDTFEIAPGCLDFLEWAISRFRCRWLSTWCRRGWPDGSRRAFRLAGADLDDPRWAVLDLISPAVWTVDKFEAIDSASDFWWLDDAPTENDRNWLRDQNCEKRLIQVSVNYDPGALVAARAMLEWAF